MKITYKTSGHATAAMNKNIRRYCNDLYSVYEETLKTRLKLHKRLYGGLRKSITIDLSKTQDHVVIQSYYYTTYRDFPSVGGWRSIWLSSRQDV